MQYFQPICIAIFTSDRRTFAALIHLPHQEVSTLAQPSGVEVK